MVKANSSKTGDALVSHSACTFSSATPTSHKKELGRTSSPLQIDSQTLFAGRRELIIEHQGERYQLRVTRQNKLILTK
ncbi:MAG: hemin uptake protein HemP [Burkholderiaceae bacterium]|nr:hemin uptake protein HemP [Burkholderiaceae bacterium]